MKAERLFLDVLDDIENRLSNPARTEYDLLQVASLLRQLLLDGNRLLDQANTETRRRIRFRVNRVGRSARPTTGVLMDVEPMALRPRANANPEDLDVLTRDQFIKLVVVVLDEQTYHIGDIIDICANSLGGRHLGRDTQAGRSQALWDATEGASWQGVSVPAAHVEDIARTVLQSLLPLRMQLRFRSV